MSRVTVDLSSLPGWGNVASGTHTLTVVAKASGYQDSDPSAGATFTKSGNEFVNEGVYIDPPAGTYTFSLAEWSNGFTLKSASHYTATLTALSPYGEGEIYIEKYRSNGTFVTTEWSDYDPLPEAIIVNTSYYFIFHTEMAAYTGTIEITYS